MKYLAFVLSMVVAGCGGAGAGESTSQEAPVIAPIQATAVEPDTQTPEPVVAKEKTGPVDITGAWENSSCGERQYPRKVSFNDKGTFTGLDEVAPCPPNAMCVWSGIISWGGTWKLEDRDIVIDIKPIGGDKQPDSLPKGFVVLATDPVSIGEREGDVICPYQKK
jgi:hypothetical protein